MFPTVPTVEKVGATEVTALSEMSSGLPVELTIGVPGGDEVVDRKDHLHTTRAKFLSV